MGVTPSCITQGQRVLQLTVAEYSVTFLDSYKYFSQKLSSLPKRFGLPEIKGHFCLLATSLKFLSQTMQFGEQMIERFGSHPSWKEHLHQQFFHHFSQKTPTLGSYL